MSWRARLAITLLSFGVTLASVPRVVAGRDAGAWFEGERETQDALARRVAASVLEQRELQFYHSGNQRFDGQSAIAIYQMTLLGLGQVVLRHPELRDAYLPAMRVAAERLADPRTHPYAASVYKRHGVSGMAPGSGHAYLGYINLGLGMLRLAEPDNDLAKLHDRLNQQLSARLFASSNGLIETYPNESWPPDVAAVAGSIGLHALATGGDRSQELKLWSQRYARCAIDGSGYLIQRVKSAGCTPLDAPRGSGTAVGSYFISFVDPPLSRRLFEALAHQGRRSLLGFGGVREYATGHDGKGDVNAGPILLGVSVGATGFGIGAARANSDRDFYRELYRTAQLFGVPTASGAGLGFAVGGALGNALLLAMLTAIPPSELPERARALRGTETP